MIAHIPARAFRFALVGLGLAVAIALAALSSGSDRYETADGLYSALRQQPHIDLPIGGGEIDVVFADGTPGLDRAPVMAWIRRSAQSVTAYFGRFPVRRVGLLVIADDSARIGSGTTYGFSGSAIRIHVGRHANAAAFRDDWILVHEMTHLALPIVPERSEWLLEGNATYVEPIARAQAGLLNATEVWRWALEGMPKGEPRPGDRGLDETHTWGRTYWGGATFWLLADVQMLEETHGQRGAQEALQAINRRSGGNTADWTVDQVMASGDAATRTQVLATFYAKMKSAPAPTDLTEIFKALGVGERDGRVVFDDEAPLAAIRRRITEPHRVPGSAR